MSENEKPERKLTPHARIVLAFRKRRGLRLSAEEVEHLFYDDAIEHRGLCDLGERSVDSR